MGNDHSHEASSPTISSAKLVVVGDNMRQLKTRWLMTYVDPKPADPTYIPTVFDNYTCDVDYKGVKVNLSLWDTTGQEEYERLRPLTYPQTDVVIMLYNKLDLNSFKNISDIWVPEVMRYIPNAPIVLVECEGEDTGAHVSAKQADDAKESKSIIPYCVEKTTLSDWNSIKKVVDVRAIEAIEFSRTLRLDHEFERISKEVNERFGGELARLKKEAEEAEKKEDHATAKIKKEEHAEIENQIRRRTHELCREFKYKTYANKLGWK